jgi:tetratricopeptide (TPR) repeat protein
MIRNKGEKPLQPQNHSHGFTREYSFGFLIFVFLGGFLAGVCIEVLKERNSAQRVWSRTVEREKGENLQPYVQAREAYCRGDVSRVIQILETEEKLRETFSPASVLMGKALFFQGRIEEAEDVWKGTLDRRPWNQEARKWLARLYLQEDQGKEAEQVCIPALSEDPEDPELLILVGKARLIQGDVARALEYFGKGESCFQRLAEGPLELAELYRGFGMRERSMEKLELALALLGKESSIRRSVEETLKVLRIDLLKSQKKEGL